jgi:hypothetical protein
VIQYARFGPPTVSNDSGLCDHQLPPTFVPGGTAFPSKRAVKAAGSGILALAIGDMGAAASCDLRAFGVILNHKWPRRCRRRGRVSVLFA